MITFPFKRGILYQVHQLTAFSDDLVAARQHAPELSEAIRARRLPWAKLWCEELYPAKLFAERNQLSDAGILVTAVGAPADLEIHSSETVLRLQITLAYPDWDWSAAQSRNPGYIASLERTGIDQGTPVFLGGQITKTTTGQIVSEPLARSNEVDLAACQMGLRRALESKWGKATKYAGQIDVLLVYFSRFRFHTDFADSAALVIPVITEVIKKFGRSPFKKVAMVDDDLLAYVEYKSDDPLPRTS